MTSYTNFTLLVMACLMACQPADTNNQGSKAHQETGISKEAPPSGTHNSQNALDWGGTYKGVLPCADCEGIASTVVINLDHSFSKEDTYLGKSATPFKEAGSFSWDSTGSIITLLAGNVAYKYKVEENQLRWLDQAGNKITGSLEANYLLKKQP